MSWAQRRKLLYIGGILLVFLVFVVLPIAWSFYKAPTCFDNKQNQDEQGIDCGGSCTLLCRSQYAPLNVLWSRFSKINDGVYNALAYIENPNISAGANDLNYSFKLYGKAGMLLRERTGRTFAPANKIIAIFEPDLQTGNQIPQRVDFSFTSQAVWLKQESVAAGLSVSQSVVSREDTAPRLSSVITNETTKPINNIEAIAIIYNVDGNTIAFSRTIIDSIPGQEARTIYFNWPKPFPDVQSRTEIVLKVLK